ncbi:MAG: LysM peptidoglycan-binding domain-containing protein [Ignavibacteria bacterium]|jgi:nucleoid-associated protein YgaU|nr:LysM peptidoglycan-binding domain-containing protein [Ignavibacteria bacterium]
MKFHKLLIALLVLSLTLGVKLSVFAQDEEETEEPEMDEEQWQQQMDEYTAKKNELTAKLDQLDKDIDALKKKNADKDAELKKAEDDLYASVGATKEKIADYRKVFETAEKYICPNQKTGKKEDAMKLFEPLTMSGVEKYKCLPEFFERYKKMKNCLDTWPEKKIAGYTVVKGDCLYKIAGKKEIYNNVKMWPVLWEANEKGVASAPPKVSKTIKNPNLIYPGQVLNVPALTEDLKKKAEQKAKKYRYHRKPKVEKKEGDVKKDEKKDVKKEEPKKDVKKDVKKEEPKKEEKKK